MPQIDAPYNQNSSTIVQEYLQDRSVTDRRQQAARGIVIPAGGGKQIANAYLSVYAIREVHHSDLPVVIFFNGENEMHPLLNLIQVIFHMISCQLSHCETPEC